MAGPARFSFWNLPPPNGSYGSAHPPAAWLRCWSARGTLLFFRNNWVLLKASPSSHSLPSEWHYHRLKMKTTCPVSPLFGIIGKQQVLRILVAGVCASCASHVTVNRRLGTVALQDAQWFRHLRLLYLSFIQLGNNIPIVKHRQSKRRRKLHPMHTLSVLSRGIDQRYL